MIQHTRTGPTHEKARYERTRVAVTRGPNAGLVVEAAGRTLRIGTADDCDIVLTDDTVSRRHCEIELTETGFRVRDAGSTNGVRSAGLRVYDLASSSP
ncbi:MAG TPA: FHA domain-containing protein, partial [Polyangiales bacterium]